MSCNAVNSLLRMFFVLVLLTLNLYSNAEEAFILVNKVRKEVKMVEFAGESHLRRSAQDHASYLVKNNATGHYQRKGTVGFTGVKPSDRAVYSGYPTTAVAENLSIGSSSYISPAYGSVSNLMSAIYHRFGFLDFVNDSMGVGVKDEVYIYDMGNKKISDLCRTSTLKFGFLVCSDKSRGINKDDFNNAQGSIQKQNPAFVVYPVDKQENVFPSFFIESPHPLPGSSVSGFPISISFNPYFATSPKVESISLYAPEHKLIEGRFMNYKNDPNHKFEESQFAFFPKLKLHYNTKYNVEIKYSFTPTKNFKSTTTSGLLKTSFTTEKPDIPMYILNDFSNTKTLKIIPDKKYLIYVQPKHSNDLPFSKFSFSKTGSTQEKLDIIDGTLLSAKVSGRVGLEIIISFKQDSRKLTLLLSDTDDIVAIKDNATNMVKNEISIKYKKGWNLLVSPVNADISVSGEGGYKLSSIGLDQYIYIMKNGEFKNKPTVIETGEGFLLYSKKDGQSNKVMQSPYLFTKKINKGWNLFGLSVASTDLKKDLKLNIDDVVFVFRDNKYIQDPMSIKSGEGFLLYRKK